MRPMIWAGFGLLAFNIYHFGWGLYTGLVGGWGPAPIACVVFAPLGALAIIGGIRGFMKLQRDLALRAANLEIDARINDVLLKKLQTLGRLPQDPSTGKADAAARVD